jgi:hypothetical protein
MTDIIVSATPADSRSTVTGTGTRTLIIGPNTLNIVVTAPDGTTQKTYTIVVTRSLSANANLSNITLSTGVLTPTFNSGVVTYTVSVPNATTSIVVTGTPEDPNGTVTGNGTYPLASGDTVITLVGHAADGIAERTYTVTVTRGANNEARLASLFYDQGTLVPAFSPDTFNYTITVERPIDQLTSVATPIDPLAIYGGDGNIILALGANT